MQLGYTIPLQRHLRMKPPPCGAPCDLRLCWDLHRLRPGGAAALFAVHASSRFALLLCGLDSVPPDEVAFWFCSELRRCLLDEGFPPAMVDTYLALAGEAQVTRTHGRRPVAFLNRAVDDLYTLPVAIEPDAGEQAQVRRFLNDMPCRAAGHDDRATARAFLHRDLQTLRP